MNTSLYIETENASKTTGPGITHYNSEFLHISSNVNYFFPQKCSYDAHSYLKASPYS